MTIENIKKEIRLTTFFPEVDWDKIIKLAKKAKKKESKNDD